MSKEVEVKFEVILFNTDLYHLPLQISKQALQKNYILCFAN